MCKFLPFTWRYALYAAMLCAVLLPAGTMYAQDNTITGVVRAEDQSPLPGVSVLVKNSVVGTVTDSDGRFSIRAPADAIFVISFIGMLTQEVNVNGASTLEVTLKADVTQLGEVVVVGYGTQRKSDVTGAVASVPMM